MVVSGAINTYFLLNSKLPCPASMITDENGQLSNKSTNCEDLSTDGFLTNKASKLGLVVSENTEGQLIVSGYVPSDSLGISSTNTKDAWYRNIRYHVSLDLTNFETYQQFSGAITLVNNKDEVINWDLGKAQFALISNGLRGCVEGLEDFVNCKNFESFLISETSKGDTYYDDIVVYDNFISNFDILNSLECSIEQYFKDQEIDPNKFLNYSIPPFVAARGTLKICNPKLLSKMNKNKDYCLTLNCLNGELVNKEVIID